MDDVILFLREFGFPVFVVLWFMFRTETILKRNSEAINRLSESMERLDTRCPLYKTVRGLKK